MKKIYIIVISILLFSCASIKKTENKIANDFLIAEFAKDRYKPYITSDLFLIEEKDQCTPILAYEYALRDMKEFTKNKGLDSNNYEKEIWVLDSLEVQSLKEKCKNEKTSYWKTSDFNTFNFKLISNKDYLKIRMPRVDNPERKILLLSKPYIIKNNFALIYFQFQNCSITTHTIERFIALLKKVDGKWVFQSYIDDGVMY